MQLSLSSYCLLILLVALVAAWSKEDQEIFRLNDEVATSEGVGATFYSFLGISPSASQDEIGKAYKKKSRTLHPDKVKQQFIAEKSTGKGKSKGGRQGVNVSKGPSQAEIKVATKAASDRFTRLGLVAAILRGSGRERYDHFLSNGFPTWKGTGYYYARFRPGLGSVLLGLFVFAGGGGHYFVLYMSWKRQRDFVGRYIKFARHAAWGDNMGIPGLESMEPGQGVTTSPLAADLKAEGQPMPMNRRERRMQEKDSRKEELKKGKKNASSKTAKASLVDTPPSVAMGRKKRVVAENGKILVVDSVGNVFLEQADDEGEVHEFLLDPNELQPPTFRETALARVPIWIYEHFISLFIAHNRTKDKTVAHGVAVTLDTSDGEDDEVVFDGEFSGQAADEVKANAITAESARDQGEEFELLEKVKTTAPNGTGKAVKRSKRSGKGR